MPPNITQVLAGLRSGGNPQDVGSPVGRGIPGQPDSPAAESALNRAILALHVFLSLEKDPQDRALVAQCMARLEGLKSKRNPPPPSGGGPPASAGPSGPGGNY